MEQGIGRRHRDGAVGAVSAEKAVPHQEKVDRRARHVEAGAQPLVSIALEKLPLPPANFPEPENLAGNEQCEKSNTNEKEGTPMM